MCNRVAMCPASLLVSRKEAAALLGISVGMISKLARKGRLAKVRIGRRVLFRRDAVEALALTNEQGLALRGSRAGIVQ
jgi:excisionase family DNA binding protein